MIPNRVKLGDVVPLDTPFSLYVFPTNFCNFKCIYCEHSLPDSILSKRSYYRQVMDFSVFKKAIDDLRLFPQKLKTITFVGMGEPLMHPQIVDMVSYAHKSNVSERVEIITNGFLLSNKMSDALINAGLTRLRISIQGVTAERYEEVCGIKINFSKFIENISYFFHHKRDRCSIYIKIIDCALQNQEEEATFHKLFGSICDDIAIEYMNDGVEEIDYSNVGKTSNQCQHGGVFDTNICTQPFYQIYLMPNGDIIPCCNLNSNFLLGNVKDTTLFTMWNSQQHMHYLLNHLDGYNTMACCKGCTANRCSFTKEDRLDDHVETIRNKIQLKIQGA